jgi:hemolysin-activating ACP:hemolysin acyltransferase
MLKETKYDNKKILGGIVVLLKDDAEFQEFRVPSDITKTILSIDIRKYTK